MAHEFETGFFTHTPAWHGLGTVLPNAPSIDEAIVAAGLDWTVSLQDLFAPDGRKVTHKVVVRDTDQSHLGVVGPDFAPLYNVDAFEPFRPLVESREITLEAAGSLKNGKRIWILAKLANATADVTTGDPVNGYALLAHGHDGTMAVRLGFTAVRVVCQNTLSAALQGDKLIKVSHRGNVAMRVKTLMHGLDMARGEFRVSIEAMRELAKRKCSDADFERYAREVFEPGKADDKEAGKRILAQVFPLFQAGRGMDLPGVRGTYWGAYNAVTEHLTHNRGRSADTRVDSQWFGTGADLIRRSLLVAQEFAAAA